MPRKISRRILPGAALALVLSSPALAQSYPVQNVPVQPYAVQPYRAGMPVGYPAAYGGYNGYGYGYPGMGQAQPTPQLYAAPQQMPGQYQAAFPAAPAGPGPQGPAVVDPPGGLSGHNAPGGMASGIRDELLSRNARGNGFRAGFADEMARINASLDRPDITRQFEGRFDFRPLLVDGTVIPPVITEVREVAELKSDRVVQLSSGTFHIAAPARLALKVPNWRDYLEQDATATPYRGPKFTPRTPEEQRQFNEISEQAHDDGVIEARETFEVNLNRLIRDYEGMQLYHQLAATGAVSLPKVTRTSTGLVISGRGTRAAVGNQKIELIISPKFRRASPRSYLAGRSVPPRPQPRAQAVAARDPFDPPPVAVTRK